MFWKSIIEGVVILGHWQVWVAVILYMAVNFGFLMIVSTVVGEAESGGRMATGCLFHMIGGTVLHGILMGLMVAFLLPILLGGSSAAPISGIIAQLWSIIKIGIIAVIAVIILSIMPIIGAFIADSPGIQAFLEGAIIFRLLSGYATEEILRVVNVQISVYPGFWASIGFLVIAGVLVRVIIFGVALLSVPLEGTALGELVPAVIVPVIGVLGGIVPLFMYGSYVRLSVMQLIGG